MEHLVEDLRAAIPAAFETDDYRARRREIDTESAERQQKALEDVRARAKQENIALLQTPDGSLIFAPMRNGEPVDPEAFSQWGEKGLNRLRQPSEDFRRTWE
jgi:hypothetical protein